jgi:hypothetical protein
MTLDRRAFRRPEEIFRDVQGRLARAEAAAEPVDYLAFVPDGEPTLDINLGSEVAMLKPLGVPAQMSAVRILQVLFIRVYERRPNLLCLHPSRSIIGFLIRPSLHITH